MHASPYEFFEAWFELARQAKFPQYDSMVVISASKAGKPSGRMLLLKGVVDGQFRFFTNYESRKARELIGNPQAQLLFYWPVLGHQIRIEGTVAKLSAQASDEYWYSRPRDSRIGAIASHQSRALGSMTELKARVAEIEAAYAGKEVPRPDHWGGFGLAPSRFEFWKDGEFRLHERIIYERIAGEWTTSRLWP